MTVVNTKIETVIWMFELVFSLIALSFSLIDFRTECQDNSSETAIVLFVYL